MIMKHLDCLIIIIETSWFLQSTKNQKKKFIKKNKKMMPGVGLYFPPPFFSC